MTEYENICLIRFTNATQIHEEIRQIYEEAFPWNERRDWESLTKLLNIPEFRLNGIFQQNTLIGMLSVWNLDEFLFIEHFAFRPDERGKGFGSAVIRELTRNSKLPVLLEVDEAISETNRKRVAFYERLNFKASGCDYFQPPYSIDQQKVKMLLMSHPDKIKDEHFTKLKAHIYRTVYGVSE